MPTGFPTDDGLPGRQRRVAEDEATLQGALRVGGALRLRAVLGEEDLAAHLARWAGIVYVYVDIFTCI